MRVRLALVATAVIVLSTVGASVVGCARSSRTTPAMPSDPAVSIGPSASVSASAPPASPAPTLPGSGSTRPPTKGPAPTGSALPGRLRGTDIERIPTTRRVVALTFDAGANDEGLASILATLAANLVPGTFFLTGQFAERRPTSVRSIVAGGHRLGNHTWSHPHLTQESDAATRDQLSRAEAAIRGAGDVDPRPLFRFPYGDRNARTIRLVNDAGYACVRWTVDTLGWKGTSAGITAQTVVDRVLGAAGPGEIVLMHIGSNPTDHSTLDADALPTIIRQLKQRGYQFVTLAALL